MIIWKKGRTSGARFGRSYWYGKRQDNKEFSIWYQVEGGGRNFDRIIKFALVPSHKLFNSLKEAKQAAENF